MSWKSAIKFLAEVPRTREFNLKQVRRKSKFLKEPQDDDSIETSDWLRVWAIPVAAFGAFVASRWRLRLVDAESVRDPVALCQESRKALEQSTTVKTVGPEPFLEA